jgi:hypothetical protein
MMLIILLAAALFSPRDKSGWQIMAEARMHPKPTWRLESCTRLPSARIGEAKTTPSDFFCFGISIEW